MHCLSLLDELRQVKFMMESPAPYSSLLSSFFIMFVMLIKWDFLFITLIIPPYIPISSYIAPTPHILHQLLIYCTNLLNFHSILVTVPHYIRFNIGFINSLHLVLITYDKCTDKFRHKSI